MNDQDIYIIGSTIVIIILSIIATIFAINRKERSIIWAWLTLFFYPTLLIVELLPNKSKKNNAATFSCSACGHIVSYSAKICPNCGHPSPIKNNILYIFYEMVICILIIVQIFFVILDGINLFPTELPKCNSNRAKNAIIKTFEESQLRRNLGLSIINMYDMETSDYKSDGIYCKAQVTLNDSQNYTINYKFYIKDDEVYSQFELKP